MQRALTDAGDRKLVHLDSAYAAYSEIFSKDCTYKVTVFDGMRQTLETLKAMGMKLAVLSNKPHAQTKEVTGRCLETASLTGYRGSRRESKRSRTHRGLWRLQRFSV